MIRVLILAVVLFAVGVGGYWHSTHRAVEMDARDTLGRLEVNAGLYASSSSIYGYGESEDLDHLLDDVPKAIRVLRDGPSRKYEDRTVKQVIIDTAVTLGDTDEYGRDLAEQLRASIE